MIRLTLGKAAFFSLLTAIGVSSLPSFSLAQTSSFIPSNDYTLKTDVRLVLLDVSVKDKAGAFVSGLSKDDFAVFENGREQAIKIFNHDDLPAAVGLLVDSSSSMLPKRQDVLLAAQEFIRQSNRRDDVFVLNFNDRVRRGLPEGTLFTSDERQLHEALYRGRPSGKTALNDAVIAGLEQLKSATRDRRTLIVISDGGDNASVHTREEMLRRVEESMVTVHTIGLYEPGEPDQDPAVLKKLAKVSGGEAYFPTNPSQMTTVCSRIAKDIRQRYVVGYTPQNDGKGELRQIRFRVKGPGNAKLQTRARTSYRYDELPDAIENKSKK